MAVTMDAVQAALKGLIDPNTQKDFLTSKEVKNINVDGDTVSLEIELGYPANSQLNAIRNLVVGAVKAVPGVAHVNANVSYKIVAHAVQGTLKPLKGVKNIVHQLLSTGHPFSFDELKAATGATPTRNAAGNNWAVGGARVGTDVVGALGYTPSLASHCSSRWR